MRKTEYLLTAGLLATFLAGCGSGRVQTATGGMYTAAETAVETKAAADSRLETAADTAGETVEAETAETETTEIMEEVMRIKVETNGSEIVFELNDSQAAKDLYEQLPLTMENEDFSNNEKTFYPPEKLDVSDAPGTDGSIGTLAYYEPWGDVVLFYGSYQPNSALYALGRAISGSEYISEISGEIIIAPVE